MIIGNGIDLIEINRIEGAMQNPRFLTEYFTEEERAYFEKRHFSPAVVAANFAGKEAFSKALGTGIAGFLLKEVGILREASGKPYIALTGAAERLCREKGISRLFISLTHSETHAAAQVLAEGREEPLE
ncbi:MAG: holo-[acyl-carrier-protein] synthase [Ruminococcaceae bacterium]|nr:holo-[acyl-carrier-protein] synthase [Oscillospiraceae bacterium]